MRASKKLQCVGGWCEDLDDHYSIHPALLIDPLWRTEQRGQIIHYLKNGVQAGGRLGYHKFRLNDEGLGRIYDHDRSDGVWVWPEALPLYVERNVRLPEAFVQHMESVAFDPLSAGVVTDDVLGMERSDLFWNWWCARWHEVEDPLDEAEAG